jgi:hypothetical protein
VCQKSVELAGARRCDNRGQCLARVDRVAGDALRAGEQPDRVDRLRRGHRVPGAEEAHVEPDVVGGEVEVGAEQPRRARRDLGVAARHVGIDVVGDADRAHLRPALGEAAAGEEARVRPARRRRVDDRHRRDIELVDLREELEPRDREADRSEWRGCAGRERRGRRASGAQLLGGAVGRRTERPPVRRAGEAHIGAVQPVEQQVARRAVGRIAREHEHAAQPELRACRRRGAAGVRLLGADDHDRVDAVVARGAKDELELADLVAREPERPDVVALHPHVGADGGAEPGQRMQRRRQRRERRARQVGPGRGHRTILPSVSAGPRAHEQAATLPGRPRLQPAANAV